MKILFIIIILFYNSLIFAQKKILLIDSYHKEYSWSKDILKGIKYVIDNQPIELKIYYLETKNPNYKSYINNKVSEVLKLIALYEPDLIIASDDNSSKYVISKYFKDADIPIVFCGINWDASIYGYPYKNTTGMIEVAPIKLLLNYLYNYSKGTRIGFIYADSTTTRKDLINIEKKVKLKILNKAINNINQFEKEFIKMQSEVDIIIIGNLSTLKGLNYVKLRKIVENNIKIPTGTLLEFNTDMALIGFTKLGFEQGEWSARTALKILDGMKPRHIDISENKRGRLYINTRIAEKLNITIPPAHLKSAHQIIRKE